MRQEQPRNESHWPGERQAVGNNFKPPVVDSVDLQIHVCQTGVASDKGPRLMANPRGATFPKDPEEPLIARKQHGGRQESPEGDDTGRSARRGGAGGGGRARSAAWTAGRSAAVASRAGSTPTACNSSEARHATGPQGLGQRKCKTGKQSAHERNRLRLLRAALSAAPTPPRTMATARRRRLGRECTTNPWSLPAPTQHDWLGKLGWPRLGEHRPAAFHTRVFPLSWMWQCSAKWRAAQEL